MYLLNVSKAILRVLLAIDCLGNALTGGYFDNSVSGRVGYFATMKPNRFWLLVQWFIDETFRPLEGRHHCYNAFIMEAKQKKGITHRRSSDVALAVLSIFVVLVCLILAPCIYLIAGFRSKKVFGN